MLHRKRSRLKIALFGHFGARNFGNETTLEAMLSHLRRLLPESDLSCICTEPQVVTAMYNIPAVPLTATFTQLRIFRNPIAKLLRTAFVGLPCEIYRWLSGLSTLRDTDALIVTGTGLLTDVFGLRGWGPYNTFKWSLIARLCGCRLCLLAWVSDHWAPAPEDYSSNRPFASQAIGRIGTRLRGNILRPSAFVRLRIEFCRTWPSVCPLRLLFGTLLRDLGRSSR